jgi:serine/threonine protein phosphatase PrpC
LRFAAGTDTGLIRNSNEDSYRIIPESSQNPCVVIIADGMGGHNCGEVASRMTVDYISEFIERSGSLLFSSPDIGAEVRRIVAETNTAVFEASLTRPEASGMGTTLTMAVIIGSKVTVAHVGDSRLYMAHNDTMQQMTQDHSYIEELIKNGTLTREEAERHPRKHVITRAIGSSRDLEIDILDFEAQEGDVLLLCTDGLTNMICENEIYNIIKDSEPQKACEQLIEAAKSKGGEDNITVIVYQM